MDITEPIPRGLTPLVPPVPTARCCLTIYPAGVSLVVGIKQTKGHPQNREREACTVARQQACRPRVDTLCVCAHTQTHTVFCCFHLNICGLSCLLPSLGPLSLRAAVGINSESTQECTPLHTDTCSQRCLSELLQKQVAVSNLETETAAEHRVCVCVCKSRNLPCSDV